MLVLKTAPHNRHYPADQLVGTEKQFQPVFGQPHLPKRVAAQFNRPEIITSIVKMLSFFNGFVGKMQDIKLSQPILFYRHGKHFPKFWRPPLGNAHIAEDFRLILVVLYIIMKTVIMMPFLLGIHKNPASLFCK